MPASVLILGAAGASLLAPFDSSAAPVRSVGVYGPGFLAIGLGLFVWVRHGLLASHTGRTESAELKREERVRDAVGNRIDRGVQDGTDLRTGTRSRIEVDVEQAVQATLERAEGLSPAAARERIRDGTWTADPRAATLLGRSDHRPPGLRLRDWLTGRGYRRCLRAAIDELERRRGVPAQEMPTSAVQPRAYADPGIWSRNRSRAPIDSPGTVDELPGDESTDAAESATDDDSGTDVAVLTREAIR